MTNQIDGAVPAPYLQSFELAVQYVHGSIIERDLPRAAELFETAATLGYDRAQFNLGLMYLNGLGVTRCRETAVHWLRQAAQQGHPDAVRVLRRIMPRRSAASGNRLASPDN
jgi:uncharacterized protein